MEVLIVPFHIQYLKLNNSNENIISINTKFLRIQWDLRTCYVLLWGKHLFLYYWWFSLNRHMKLSENICNIQHILIFILYLSIMQVFRPWLFVRCMAINWKSCRYLISFKDRILSLLEKFWSMTSNFMKAIFLQQ